MNAQHAQDSASGGRVFAADRIPAEYLPDTAVDALRALVMAEMSAPEGPFSAAAVAGLRRHGMAYLRVAAEMQRINSTWRCALEWSDASMLRRAAAEANQLNWRLADG